MNPLTTLTKSRTVRNSLVTLTGSAITAGLGFAATALIARHLGTQNFGIFSLATTVMTFVVSLSDFGLGTALSRFVGKYHPNDPLEASRFAKIVLEIEIGIGLAIALGGLTLPAVLSQFLRGDSSLVEPLQLSFLAAFGLSFNAFVLALLQAYQLFVRLAVWQTIVGLSKFGAVVLLIITSALSIQSALWIYALVPILGFAVGIFFWPSGIWQTSLAGLRSQYVGQVFSFTKWLFLSYIINTIAGRADVFFLTKFKDLSTVGVYSAAYQLALAMPLFIGALTSVLLPKVSGFTTKEQFTSYLRRAIPLLIGIIVLLLPVLVISQYIVPLIFSDKYVAAIPIFNIIFAGYLLAVLSNPIGIIIYSLDRPRIMTAINLVSLIVIVLGNFWLVPQFGGEGAAWAFVISNFVGASLGLITVFTLVKKL